MGNRSEVEMDAAYRKWRELLYRPEFRDMTRVDQGKAVGVSHPVIKRWYEEMKPETWANILKTTREVAAEQSLEIDLALFRKAKAGDVAAIKLWKESIEGWSPRQNVDITARAGGDITKAEQDDLLKSLLQGMTEEDIKRLKEAPPKELTVTDLVRADEANGKFLP